MRERGLKFGDLGLPGGLLFVAPHAGAWIEIFRTISLEIGWRGRSPCGSVD